jgi:hypothetical protein
LKELKESSGRLQGNLFRHVVPARQRAAVDLDRVLAPDREDVPIVAADEAVLTPQGQQRGGHLIAAGRGRVVVRQVGRGGGPVVLAGGVDRRRIPEAPDVLAHRPRVEWLAAASEGAHPAADPAVRVQAQQLLGERFRLREEEPVPVAHAERDVGRVERVPGRNDVEHRELGDRLRVVQRHPVADPGATVVPHHGELVESEFAHHQHLVPRHRALRVRLMIVAARGLAAVAVAAKVGEDYGVMFGEYRRDVMPHDVGLRVAVQQQYRAAVALAPDKRVYPYSVW